MTGRAEIEWAPRVSLSKIRELYVDEASGTCGDEQVAEVGFALYARCQSILEYTAACAGQVLCKRCARAGQSTLIERKTTKPAEMLRCPVCGWQVRWRVYVAESEKVDGQLHAGNAGQAFRRYVARYPLCQTREEKILAIDRLIHEFHWVLIEAGQNTAVNDPALARRPAEAWKPAGVNLLRGTTTQVIELLYELTYGEHTPPELLENREWWKSQRPIQRRKE